jgi:hypothetical protein
MLAKSGVRFCVYVYIVPVFNDLKIDNVCNILLIHARHFLSFFDFINNKKLFFLALKRFSYQLKGYERMLVCRH